MKLQWILRVSRQTWLIKLSLLLAFTTSNSFPFLFSGLYDKLWVYKYLHSCYWLWLKTCKRKFGLDSRRKLGKVMVRKSWQCPLLVAHSKKLTDSFICFPMQCLSWTLGSVFCTRNQRRIHPSNQTYNNLIRLVVIGK